MTTFSDILDESMLLELAGDRSFYRGVDYFEHGLVQHLAEYDDQITADVEGTHNYRVNLWLQGDHLQFRCTCPVGQEGWFCKHSVATALAWIDEPPPYRPPEEAPPKPKTSMEMVRDYLASQDHEALVNLVLNRAMSDTQWRDQLLIEAAAHQAGGPDLAMIRQSLINAIATGGFIDYYEADSYVEGVRAAIQGLEDVLDAGFASEVVELAEEAIWLLEDEINSVDDSGGSLSLVMDQVQDLHHRACAIARPDPQALAERLFYGELKSGYGFFYNALETYGDILGDAGLAAYRRLVDVEWSQLPGLSQTNSYSFDYRRSQLSRMKEALVEATGNLEDLVAVIAKDLSQPQRYLRIAQLYQQANQPQAAIAWTERGLEAFKGRYSANWLVEFLVDAYEQQGRFDDAVGLVWDEFAANPSLPLYQKVQRQAEKAATWDTWRNRALTLLADSDGSQRRDRIAVKDASLLVEILLWDEDFDRAWEAAQSGGCSQHLWMRLADQRATTHPEEALAVYQPAIEPLINQTNNEAYRQAVDLLLKVKVVMERLDRQADFDRALQNLKATYKRKRNFIKLLKQAGLG